jgi:MSHA biogenesis protein MshP
MKLLKRQAGLGLATALFVITVMAFLAAAIFQLVRNNSETTGEEIMLIRSFYAAQTGIQFGMNRVFPPDGSATTCTAPVTTFPDYLLEENGLSECTAEVTCTPLTVSGEIYYTVESTGTCGEVSRTIQVRAQ